jgi:hypothetical protein
MEFFFYFLRRILSVTRKESYCVLGSGSFSMPRNVIPRAFPYSSNIGGKIHARGGKKAPAIALLPPPTPAPLACLPSRVAVAILLPTAVTRVTRNYFQRSELCGFLTLLGVKVFENEVKY